MALSIFISFYKLSLTGDGFILYADHLLDRSSILRFPVKYLSNSVLSHSLEYSVYVKVRLLSTLPCVAFLVYWSLVSLVVVFLLENKNRNPGSPNDCFFISWGVEITMFFNPCPIEMKLFWRLSPIIAYQCSNKFRYKLSEKISAHIPINFLR